MADLQFYNPAFMPKSLTGPTGGTATNKATTTGGRPATPRSTLLPQLMQEYMAKQKGASDYANGAMTAGLGAFKAYDQSKTPKGLASNIVDDPEAMAARRDASIGTMAGGVASGLSAALPGWYGRIAQMAGMIGSEYGKNKSQEARGRLISQAMQEPDKETMWKNLALLASQGLF